MGVIREATVAGVTMANFRAALGRGCIAVAQCASCGHQQAIPSETCFNCGSGQLAVRDHPGGGRVFSWVVNHYAFAPELVGQTPYTVLLVTLDGGSRVYGRLAADVAKPMEADMPLALDAGSTREHGYPVYRPAG